MMWVRRWIAVVCLSVLAACSGAAEYEILSVHGDPSSLRLSVGVATCRANPVVTARESDTQVRLVLEVSPDYQPGLACADGTWVTLTRALGERVVVDDRTGKELSVGPLENSVTVEGDSDG